MLLPLIIKGVSVISIQIDRLDKVIQSFHQILFPFDVHGKKIEVLLILANIFISIWIMVSDLLQLNSSENIKKMLFVLSIFLELNLLKNAQ